MKLVLCAVIFILVATVKAQDSEQNEKGFFPEYWHDDYDSFYDYPDETNVGAIESEEKTDIDKQVEAEIQDFKDQIENQNESSKNEFDVLRDYQFEDNRSDNKDSVKDNSDSVPAEESLPDETFVQHNVDDLAVLPIEPVESKVSNDHNENEEAAMYDNSWDGQVDKEIDTLIVPDPLKEAIEKAQETKSEEIETIDKPQDIKLASEEKSDLESVEQADLNAILEETKQFLEETKDDFKEDYELMSDEDEKTYEDIFAENNNDDETPEQVLGDLNDDLDKLFETLDKLTDNDSGLGEINENINEGDEQDDVKDYESKFGRPYKEQNILSLRDDYDNFDDSNLPDIFAENMEEDSIESDESNSDAQDFNNDGIQNNNGTATTKQTEDQANKTSEYLDELDRLLLLDDNEENSKKIDELVHKIWSHSYGEDGLIDNDQPKNNDAEVLSTTEIVSTTQTEDLTSTSQDDILFTTAAAKTASSTQNEVSSSLPEEITEATSSAEEIITSTQDVNTETTEAENTVTKMVDDLTSSEYNDLMQQFAIANSEDLDMNSDDFAKNVAPIHITLSLDEPIVITSPDYPNPYPVNNIVDWIIEGPGVGIEMNLTHLQVNGAIGDYLLVKPGGIDESGTDGLIFSYRLNQERKYRFTNVNRMFIRFEAKQGMRFFNGFSLSAKMIWPLPEVGREEVPEPAPVVRPPSINETLILSLAGLTLAEFQQIRPSFKELIASMAQEYIEDNNIDPGINTTLEVTQITRSAVCNIRWPNYETCVEVSFGVPLHYDKEVEQPRLTAEDLDAMWRTYIVKEQFASKLREMGITEYAIPNDSTILMVWLVIAAGVVISMAMLAFALWRFSCFEDYTRMRAFNDTDSIQNEKRNLDLYPTPHQTLPPLYSENDFKWADEKYEDTTRVELGGFANKSYVRDDLFEFESDEDVIIPRQRKDVISPRDVYDV